MFYWQAFLNLKLYQKFMVIVPLFFCLYFVHHKFIVQKRKKKFVAKLYEQGTVNYAVNLNKQYKAELQKQINKENHIQRRARELKKLGFKQTYQQILQFSAVLAVIGMIVGAVIFRGGFILILYLGCLFAYLPQIWIEFRTFTLRVTLRNEFFYFLQNVSMQLQAGKMFENAFVDILETTKLSPTLEMEIRGVIASHKMGNTYSRAFLEMYRNLGLKEIKEFADNLATFEKSGADINENIVAQTNFFFQMKEIDDLRQVYDKKLTTTITIMVIIPVVLLVGMNIFNQSFFGNFFQTLSGQLSACVCFTIMTFGVVLPKKQLHIKA